MPDCNSGILPKDLAGNKYTNPSYLQIRERINFLIKKYLSAGVLYSYLHDLKLYLKTPERGQSKYIDWGKINLGQVSGVSNDLFIDKIMNAAKLETQNHDFETEIRDYLQAVNPQIACFLESNSTDRSMDAQALVKATEEKEEYQGLLLFRKIYKQLTGDELQLQGYAVNRNEFKGNLQEEIYNYALNRIANEWSAISIYVWLMAHSTGELQRVIVQPLQNEVSHLVKFWGISYWAFSDSFLSRLQNITKNLTNLIKTHQRQDERKSEILELNYALHSVEVTFTFTSVMMQLYQWHKTLEHLYLENLFAYPSIISHTD